MDRDHAGPAGDRGLPELRGRQARSAPRHQLRHHRGRDDVRRGRRALGAAGRDGGELRRPVRGRCRRHPVGAARTGHPRDGQLHRDIAVHQQMAPRRRRPQRSTGRCHRHRIHRGAAHSGDRTRRRRTRGVPAVTRLHPALVGARPGARRARRDEGALRRDPGGPAPASGGRGAAVRILGADRHAELPADHVGLRRRATARGRRARHRGRTELGRHLLRHRGQPDGHQALRGGDRADRQGSRDRGRLGAQPPLRLQAPQSSTRATTRRSTGTTSL